VSTAEDTLDVTADPDLLVLAGAASSENTRSTWLPALLHGAQWPICARYNVIVETGRTSCGSPNMQNPKRKGGLRECFVPRVGYLYAGADYDTLELRTLAQELLELCGSSAMADALMRGDDLHLNLAAELLGITVSAAVQRYRAGDKEVEEARQLCKVANFGFPGGMIARTFVEYAAGYGVTITLAKAQQIHDSWRRAWPEMAKYFAIVQGMIGRSYTGEGTIIQSMSKRVRGGVKYCAACNTRFQGRAGDGAKEALWRLAVEEYTGRRTDGGAGISPLYGSRTVIFMHDECILEVPEASASGAAARLGEVMREAMAVWVPSIPIKAGPVLMRRWFKGAKAVQVEGRLVPAKPLKDGKNTKWVADA
jgi:DNA polymerase I-like protein with 3'-5' exonuclease and polymerase domains